MTTPFWTLERHPGTAPALIDTARTWTYADLATCADRWADALPSWGRTMGFLALSTTASAIALYLAALRSGGHVPLLLQPDTDPDLLQILIVHYCPDWIALPPDAPPPAGYTRQRADTELVLYTLTAPEGEIPLAEHLGLLLSTSGSTGSPKLVRLSYSAIAANATSIATYLSLEASDRAITTLPLAYSFGLSILNSHLYAGASLVLTKESLVNRSFWDAAREHGITSLSGVPATFEILRRMDLEHFGLGRLRLLTQAGGRLRNAVIGHFLDVTERLGMEFFVMYGQTEAAPRISYVPAHRLREKIGSIGIAVPGGALDIDPENGELIYRGPNVMLGYAESRGDLVLGHVTQGVLRTGDLARRDDDGFYYLTGRAKRFVKISGNRVNLDEVETMLSQALSRPVACSGSDDDLVVFIPGAPVAEDTTVKQLIQQRYRLFLGHVRVKAHDALPLLATGKIDYPALKVLCDE